MEHRQFKLAALALAGLMAAAPLAAEKDANDIQDSMEDLRASLGTLAGQVNNLQAANDKALVWNVNTDLRYDYAPYKVFGAGTAAQPLALPYGAPNGYTGMYAKRVELEATGKIATDLYFNLQFDFAGLKIEDTGFDYKNLSLLPFVAMPGYNWEVKVGLYRQPFGIENQTGSSSIPFPERAIMDGGYNPAGYAKIVTERVMGVQFITSHNFGMIGYKLQAAVADNTSDQDPGSSVTTGSYGAGNPSLGLNVDQDPSEFGRFGLDLNFNPKVVTLNLGGSALHNSANTVFFATTGATENWSDNYGADFTLNVPIANDVVWGEWVMQDKFNNNGAGTPAAAGNLVSHAEGWYITNSLKPLAFFNADWTNLELNARIEQFAPNVNANYAAFAVNSEQAATIGLKYFYAGKSYTSVNYTSYALNGDYSAIGASSLFSVQQQFNY